MNTFLKLDDVMAALTQAFSRLETRLINIDVKDGIATVVLLTDHRGGRVGLDELLDFCQILGLAPQNISFWDAAKNSIEIIVDLEPVTPVERPRQDPTRPKSSVPEK